MAENDVRISLVLPRELVASLDQIATGNHRSRAGEIRHLLQRHADRHADQHADQAGGAHDDQ
jgi:hypothetical protein